MPFPNPSIFRAVISDVARSTIAVQFGSDVTIDDPTGLTVATTGTPRTVTSVGGSGAHWNIGLSGAAANGDVVELVAALVNTVRDLDGNPLAPGSTTVENDVAGGSPPPQVPVPGAIIELNHSSSAIVLARGQNVRVDTSGGAPPTITTDPAPNDGDRFTITDVAGTFGTTPAVVTASPAQTIEDPATTPGTYSATSTLDKSSESFSFEWIARLVRWKAVL